MLGGTPATCVVVGIDGSPSAVDAALWAVDEAVEVGIPLRMVYVIESSQLPEIDPHDQARRLATAEVAVRFALTAVESTERPVKIEVEILQGRPVEALLGAAQTAAMLSVGARGLKHATHGRIGSTAAALSAAARCPVAIVRTHRPHSTPSRAVVIETSDTAEGSAVLHRGLEEARRRRASVRVLTPATTSGEFSTHRQRRLAEWQRLYPELEVTSVEIRGDPLDYIAAHAHSIQLVVAGRGRTGGIDALVGARGNAALRDSDCSILICEPPHAL